jgi:ketosteroid isomerase-like protein
MSCIVQIALIVSLVLSSQNARVNGPIASVVARSDSVSSSLQDQFKVLAQRWLQAYNSNDSTTLASLYTTDAQYISPHVNGLVAQGRDRLIANFRNGIRMGGHIDSLSILEIQTSCDLATLLCKYEATNSGQKAVGRNMLVLKRIGSQWVIVLHMTVV